MDAVEPRIRMFGGPAATGAVGDVDLGGPKQRGVLAVLAAEPGRVVTVDRLVDVLWDGEPPARAEVSLRGYVSNLRKALAVAGFDAATVLRFRDRGYSLDVDAASIDVHRFERLISDAGAHVRLRHLDDARRGLVAALALWRGTPFGSAADLAPVGTIAARLEQRRGEAIEMLTDLRLAAGEHTSVIADLVPEIAASPYREHLRAQLATALYRSGRPVEALRSLDDARRVLANDIGVDPGPELVELEAAILAHDVSLAWSGSSVADASDLVQPGGRADDGAPIYGRDTELATIDALLSGIADQRSGRCLVVSGEAGIGKTTLVRSLRAAGRARGLAVGWGRCSESASSAPYRSWRTALEQIAAGGGPSEPADATDAPTAEVVGADAPEPVSARLAAHLRIVDVLSAVGSPMIVVIDDLQWADDATLALLEFLANELEDLPLLLVVTVRRTGAIELPGPVAACLAELSRSANSVVMPLTGLDHDAVMRWVTDTTGPGVSAELGQRLVGTTEGNPFYLHELIALLERGDPADAGSATELHLPRMVPTAVHDVVRRRTSQLPPATQVLVSTAAVIGRRFDADILGAVVDLSPAAVLDGLRPALDLGLVEIEGEATARLAFSHALVAEALAAEQNPVSRATLHARITEAIERCRPGRTEQWLDELAYHACAGAAAGTASQAVEYSVRAAERARSAQASGDVAAHLGRALAVLAGAGDPSPQRRIELLTQMGIAHRDSGELVAGREALVEAALLGESIGDDVAVATALDALQSDSLWPGFDWSMFDQRVVALIERVLERSGPATSRVRVVASAALAAEVVYLDPRRADVVSASAVVDAEALGDPLVLARAILQRYWGISGTSGNSERAALADRLVELTATGMLPARFAPLAHLAGVAPAYERGDMVAVERRRVEARAVVHPVRTPDGWAHLQYLEASLALLEGDLDRAAGRADDVGEAMWRVRRFAATTTRAGILAVVRSEQGRIDEAVELIELIEAGPYGAPICWLKAWMLAENGRDDAAARALAAFGDPLADDWLRVPLLVAATIAAARIGQVEFLRRHLRDLEPVADRFACLGSGGLVIGPVSYALGVGHEALGDLELARSHASAAQAMTTRMAARLWHDRAAALATRLG